NKLTGLLLTLVLSGCDSHTEQPLVGQLASDRIELTAEFAEPVTARHVSEGTRVSAGDVLISQDTARIDAQLRELRALAEQQQARLDELTRGPRSEQIAAARASTDGTRRDVDFLTLEYQRALDIHEKKLASAESLDRARAALDAARAQLAVNEAKLLELLAGTTVEELRQAEQLLEQTRARTDRTLVDLQRHQLAAPVSGQLDSLLVETGERPQPGQPMAIMLGGEQPYARVYIPEAIRVRVVPGTTVTVSIDGKDESVQGTVRWVASEPAFTPYFALTEHDRGRLSFVAKIDLDYRGTRLPDGVPVQVALPADGSGQRQ
ncbi:MAG: HlyD family efflux transporter periplasmic adaptor subunit, partial [Woeseia sp.]